MARRKRAALLFTVSLVACHATPRADADAWRCALPPPVERWRMLMSAAGEIHCGTVSFSDHNIRVTEGPEIGHKQRGPIFLTRAGTTTAVHWSFAMDLDAATALVGRECCVLARRSSEGLTADGEWSVMIPQEADAIRDWWKRCEGLRFEPAWRRMNVGAPDWTRASLGNDAMIEWRRRLACTAFALQRLRAAGGEGYEASVDETVAGDLVDDCLDLPYGSTREFVGGLAAVGRRSEALTLLEQFSCWVSLNEFAAAGGAKR